MAQQVIQGLHETPRSQWTDTGHYPTSAITHLEFHETTMTAHTPHSQSEIQFYLFYHINVLKNTVFKVKESIVDVGLVAEVRFQWLVSWFDGTNMPVMASLPRMQRSHSAYK
ncbi:MAG: hypothetical protein ACLTS6_16230 [Anaerobutyricum sp.]